ncbi:uncharacterized protein BJX67DRAFT_252379 [Aspergillus lucknowensis]|uniref:Uncharacterized protein n=1 Tax=Aspergillus lucknowensis TaxID=176173 RepID=A0ABR4M223_9EURO
MWGMNHHSMTETLPVTLEVFSWKKERSSHSASTQPNHIPSASPRNGNNDAKILPCIVESFCRAILCFKCLSKFVIEGELQPRQSVGMPLVIPTCSPHAIARTRSISARYWEPRQPILVKCMKCNLYIIPRPSPPSYEWSALNLGLPPSLERGLCRAWRRSHDKGRHWGRSLNSSQTGSTVIHTKM